jgi:hypothetical protein
MSDAFFELLSRVGGAALVRATMALVLCLALAAVSHKGAGSVLPAVALVYSMLGTFMLSRALRAEKHKSPSEAASLYVLALVHYFVSYASAAFRRGRGSVSELNLRNAPTQKRWLGV